MHVRLLQHRGRTSKPQVWEISVSGHEITTTWGQLDGAMQSTTEEAPGKNFGKANEVSPEAHALEIAERYVKKRKKQGYCDEGEESAEAINFRRLPSNLAMFKPQHNPNKKLESLLAAKEIIALRKLDGYMHLVVVDDFNYPRLYTSKMEPHHDKEPGIPWMERYPELELELRNLNLPPNTILLGELVASTKVAASVEGYLVDDLEYVGQVIRSLTPKALSDQQQYGQLGYAIWDIAFWDGECLLQTWPARERLDLVWDLVRQGKLVTTPERVLWRSWRRGYIDIESVLGAPTRVRFEDLPLHGPKEVLLAAAKSLGWEGFVLIDPEATYGDRAYTLHGKHERPASVAKLKPYYEADVIVRWDPDNKIGEKGKGKHAGGVGSVDAYLWHPEKGEISIGKVGTGISDEDTIALADTSLYPMIWQISFKGWTAKGKLRHASFERVRDDKSLEECDYQQCPILREKTA